MMGYKNNWSLENPQIWIQFFILTDLININDHKTITLIKNNAVIDCVIKEVREESYILMQLYTLTVLIHIKWL